MYNNYKRELLLDSALVRTTFEANRAQFTRTVFSSAVDQAIVLLAEANQPGKISCTLELSRPGEGENIELMENTIVMSQHVNDGKGVRYETRVQIIPHGGTVNIDGSKLRVSEADKLEVRIVAGTDYRGEDAQ